MQHERTSRFLPVETLDSAGRRSFLQKASAAGGLILMAGYAGGQAAEPKKYGADGMPNGWVDNALVFVSLAADGTVSIVCHRSEIGQGVRTSMPMIVADELEANWARVKVIQATGDEKSTATRTPTVRAARGILHAHAHVRRDRTHDARERCR